MNKIEQVKYGLTSPRAIVRELDRLLIHKSRFQPYNLEGINIFQADWDNLIILDACRYDTFADIAAPALPGTLENRISRGSQTSEFVRGNFSGKQIHDTVYASANSWYARLRQEIDAELFKFVELNEETFRDPETRNIRPEPVTDAAKNVHDTYPNKRLIVHYVQPHSPFIGSTADEYFNKYGIATISELLDKPEFTRNRLKKAYEETLEAAVPHIVDLVDHLTGKTVVTSDHGELLGERYRSIPIRGYGHHGGIYREELVKVPWLVIPADEQKTIIAENPERNVVDMGSVDERLRELGYKV